MEFFFENSCLFWLVGFSFFGLGWGGGELSGPGYHFGTIRILAVGVPKLFSSHNGDREWSNGDQSQRLG